MSLEERFKFLRARRAPYVSYFVLFLVPAFALTLDLFYRSRRRRYAEHLVFGLHCQTFLLFILLVEAKLPTVLADALSYWVLAYFAIALKRVYGGTWAETLGRGSILLALYFAIFFVANLLLVFALLAPIEHLIVLLMACPHSQARSLRYRRPSGATAPSSRESRRRQKPTSGSLV